MTTSISPCLFTSEKSLSETGNKWYAMWIAPSSAKLNFQMNNSELLTQGGYEFLHWHKRLPIITGTGFSGWLQPNESSIDRDNSYSGYDSYRDFLLSEKIDRPAFIDTVKDLRNIKDGNFSKTEKWKAYMNTITEGLEGVQTVSKSNARMFFHRLQKIALEEKFFYNVSTGLTQYNTKYLTLFTKNYPGGLTTTGVFTQFEIKEEAQDSQMISYSFEFIIQSGLTIDSSGEIDLLQEFPILGGSLTSSVEAQRMKFISNISVDLKVIEAGRIYNSEEILSLGYIVTPSKINIKIKGQPSVLDKVLKENINVFATIDNLPLNFGSTRTGKITISKIQDVEIVTPEVEEVVVERNPERR